jgi:hypothetical protein
MDLKVGIKVQWRWMGRFIDGVVRDVYYVSVSRTIKGKNIKRKGSKENPAYLVESSAGNLALKLKSELNLPTSDVQTRLPKKPSMLS